MPIKNKILQREYNRKWEVEWKKLYPWAYTLKRIKARCTNPNMKDYKYYGGKGIKCLITEEELKELWFRDKAYLMKKPSIDRENSEGHYEFKNCRFIEQSKNISEMNTRTKSIPVLQFDLQGNFIKEWKSAVDITKTLGFDHSWVSKAIRGEIKRAYKHIWKKKDSEGDKSGR